MMHGTKDAAAGAEQQISRARNVGGFQTGSAHFVLVTVPSVLDIVWWFINYTVGVRPANSAVSISTSCCNLSSAET